MKKVVGGVKILEKVVGVKISSPSTFLNGIAIKEKKEVTYKP